MVIYRGLFSVLIRSIARIHVQCSVSCLLLSGCGPPTHSHLYAAAAALVQFVIVAHDYYDITAHKNNNIWASKDNVFTQWLDKMNI